MQNVTVQLRTEIDGWRFVWPVSDSVTVKAYEEPEREGLGDWSYQFDAPAFDTAPNPLGPLAGYIADEFEKACREWLADYAAGMTELVDRT